MIRKISLDEIVREAVRKYAKLFIRKKIRLDYQPLNIEVLTDEKWLEFVIEQILSNAVKYTPKGTVSIYMENEDTLIIEDTGIGRANVPQYRNRIGNGKRNAGEDRIDHKRTHS